MTRLSIGLEPWILQGQDGNYGHFKPGQSRKFALEFSGTDLGLAEVTSEPALIPADGSRYHATGNVVFATEKVWVCDFGPVMAFRGGPPSWVAEGANVSGNTSIYVEPFDYFERFHKLPGMPALTYRFMIERVILVTYPLIHFPSEKVYRPADTGHTYEDVATTERPRVREDQFKFGSYFLLDCTLLESGLERATRAERFPESHPPPA